MIGRQAAHELLGVASQCEFLAINVEQVCQRQRLGFFDGLQLALAPAPGQGVFGKRDRVL